MLPPCSYNRYRHLFPKASSPRARDRSVALCVCVCHPIAEVDHQSALLTNHRTKSRAFFVAAASLLVAAVKAVVSD